MSHRATPAITPAPGPIDGPRGGLETALDAALANASQASAAQAVVGTLVGIRPERIRHAPSIDREVLEVLCQQVAAASDGYVGSTRDSRTARWSGFRYGLGEARAAFAVVAATGLDELAAARLEAIALDVARAALLAEERRRSDQLTQLLATARQVAESLELDTVLASIVQDATTLLGANSGDMLLWDRDRDKLRVVAVSNFPPDMLGFELAFGEGISSQAILAQRTIEVDEYGTYEHRARALDRYDFGAVLCAPLVFRGAALGALNVHRTRQHGFPPGAADLLAAFAGHAAIAIDHARRYENEVRLGRVLAETNQELIRYLTVQQRLAEQVLLDAGPRGIAIVLAEHLGRCVVIQDHLHRLIAGAAPSGGDDWRRLVQGLQPSDRGSELERHPFAIAVRVGRDVVGHLLLSSDDDLGPIDRALVDVATTGVALEFAKERAAVEVEERLRGEAATDLLAGTYPSEEAIGVRAARLGYDLGEPRDLMVIDVMAPGDPANQGPAGDHDRFRSLLQQVRERLAARTPRSLAIQQAGAIVVLVGAGLPVDRDPRELADDLKACLESAVGVGRVTIAISDRCRRPDDYAPAFRLARDSVELMLKLGRRGAVVAASELGPYGLLLRVSSRDELDSFAQRTLRPLTEHDRVHRGELVSTLRAYLDEDRVQRRVAARCFIHVNTVVYRIRRIEELLGVDLGDPGTVFDVTLALRILDLLGNGATAAGSTGSPTTPVTQP